MHIQLTDKDKRQKVKPIIHTIKTRSCDVFTYFQFVYVQIFERENLTVVTEEKKHNVDIDQTGFVKSIKSDCVFKIIML